MIGYIGAALVVSSFVMGVYMRIHEDKKMCVVRLCAIVIAVVGLGLLVRV